MKNGYAVPWVDQGGDGLFGPVSDEATPPLANGNRAKLKPVKSKRTAGPQILFIFRIDYPFFGVPSDRNMAMENP